MNRVWVAVTSLALVCALNIPSTSAQKKSKAPPKAAPTSAQIAASMGELRWGMSKEDLLKKAVRKVKTKYNPLIAKTKDPVEEDRLRTQAGPGRQAISEGYVEFDGRTTGWDVSFLRGEFTHSTEESMLVVRDENSQNFYFFIGGKLWKWYKAFDAEVFPADDFATFPAAVERRFGPGKRARAELKPGERNASGSSGRISKRACAPSMRPTSTASTGSSSSKRAPGNIAKLRGGATTSAPKRHALVESVTSEREGQLDSAPDIADRISGHVRERPSAESSAATTSSTKGKEPSAARAAPSKPVAAVNSDDDPLSGLGL